MLRSMEPLTSWISNRRNRSKKSWVLRSLAGLTADNGTLYSAEFTVSRDIKPDSVKFSLSICRGPFHGCSEAGELPRNFAGSSDCYLKFSESQSRIEDSDLPFQIVQALGRIPGLVHVKFSYADYPCDPSRSKTSKLDEFERLVPVFFETICSPSRSMKQIILQIDSTRRLLSASFRIISRFCTLERFEYSVPKYPLFVIVEDDAKHIASFLRNNKSLKYVHFSFWLNSWQVSSVLEVMMEHLAKSTIDAIESAEHKNGEHNVLQKLDLVLQFGLHRFVIFDAVEAAKIMRLMFNVGSRVGHLSLSIRFCDRFCRELLFIIRMEHGTLVELDIPAWSDIGGEVVEEALRLNRGPSVLSLGPFQSAVLRKILSPLILDQNGQQANTCVSTLKLVNISDDQVSSTPELQQERLAEVAYVMELNSTIKHLEVLRHLEVLEMKPSYLHPLHCNLNHPVVIQLQNTSRSRGNLQSLKFYGKELYNRAAASNPNAEADAKKQQESKQEVIKVQCRKYLKLDQEMIVVVTLK